MPAVDEILYCWGAGESRLALLSHDRLVEVLPLRPDDTAGTVFLGRVVEVAQHLDAAFVDIGAGRPGFLPGAAGRSQGQAILVQARGEARGNKGVALTADVSLPGRHLAWAPLRPGLAVSRRLPDADRLRLAALLEPRVHPGEGVVVRTLAAACSAEELAAELAALRADWAAIEGRRAAARPPARLGRPDPLAAVLADHPAVARVVVDDAATFAELRRRFGSVVEPYRGPGSLADTIALDDEIAAALAPVVPLPSGGRLIIETTAALTAVDVDSGGGPPDRANREAVAELARQLRLRAIGGQVVVDVVAGKGRAAAARLVEALRQAVAEDPTPTHVFGTGPLGLIELTRERRRPALAEALCQRDLRATPATAACAALRRAVAEAAHRPGRPLALVLAPEVAAALAALPAAVAEAETRIGRPLAIRSEPGRERDDILVEEQTSP